MAVWLWRFTFAPLAVYIFGAMAVDIFDRRRWIFGRFGFERLAIRITLVYPLRMAVYKMAVL